MIAWLRCFLFHTEYRYWKMHPKYIGFVVYCSKCNRIWTKKL